MASPVRYTPILLLLPLLGSCSILGSMFGKAKVEAPPPPDETYLGGNAGTEFDIGRDQESLLEKLHELRTAQRRKDEEINRLKGEKNNLILESRDLKQQLATAQNMGNAQGARLTALDTEVEELRTKILTLQIRKAQQEQQLLGLRLSIMKADLDVQVNQNAPQGGLPGRPQR